MPFVARRPPSGWEDEDRLDRRVRSRHHLLRQDATRRLADVKGRIMGLTGQKRIAGHTRAWMATSVLLAAGGPLVAATAVPASAAPAAGALSVVANGLNNPRHLSFSQGSLYVAEAGTGGSGPCAIGQEGRACVGRTGDVARIDARGRVTRIMRGLSSVAGARGAAAAGPADVAMVGGTPVVVMQTTNISPTTGANPFGPAGNDLGKLVVGLRGGYGPSIPGPDFGVYEAAHNPDHGAPGNEPAIDSDPYALTPYRGGFAVADAAGNDILWVGPHGQISTLAVLPVNLGRPPKTPAGTMAPTQAVPTSVRVGPDGALYVSELSGFAGSAKVMRVVPGHAPTVYASGFDSISDIAFDGRGRLLVLEYQQGGLFGPPAPGALIRVDRRSGRRTTLASTGLSSPTGLAVHGHTIYISNHGASAAGGARGGQVLALRERG